MKTITINATCQYDVEFTKEVSDEIYDQLCDIYDNGGSISDCDLENGDAMGWLADNVSEADALNFEYKVNDLNEEEE